MYRSVESILVCTEDEYESFDLFWRTLNSADEEIELIPGGRTIPVAFKEREEYIERLVHARMAESIKQVNSFVFTFSIIFLFFNLFILPISSRWLLSRLALG